MRCNSAMILEVWATRNEKMALTGIMELYSSCLESKLAANAPVAWFPSRHKMGRQDLREKLVDRVAA